MNAFAADGVLTATWEGWYLLMFVFRRQRTANVAWLLSYHSLQSIAMKRLCACAHIFL